MKEIEVTLTVAHDTPYDARTRIKDALESLGLKGTYDRDVLTMKQRTMMNPPFQSVNPATVRERMDSDWPYVEGLDITAHDVIDAWGDTSSPFVTAYELSKR